MMKNIFKTVILLVSLLFSGCHEDENWSPEPLSDYFVWEYTTVRYINPIVMLYYEDEESHSISDFEIGLMDWLSYHNDDYNSGYFYRDSLNYPEEQRERFLELASKISDGSFGGKSSNTFGFCCPDVSVSSININTIEDYAETHKSGSSLNDIVQIGYFCADEYVDNGFNFDGGDQIQYSYSYVFAQKEALISFNGSKHTIIGLDTINLQLTIPPSDDGEYSFEIEYCQSDGTSFKGTVGPVNIKGSSR